MYLTFEEYQNMGGTLDETAFNDIIYDVQAQIDYYTFGRLQKDTEFSEQVKRCCYKLIRLVQINNQLLGTSSEGYKGAIASQSNDGVSISYNILSANEIFDRTKTEVLNVIRRYLQNSTNQAGQLLLYRGVGKNE